MAPKRAPPIDEPPSASSTEGEESEEEVSEEEHQQDPNRANAQSEEEDDEETEDEEEEEEEQVIKKPSSHKVGAKSAPSEDSDSEESDSEQTQPSPSASDFTIKPILSRPMEDSPAKRTSTRPSASGSKHTASNQTDEITKSKKGSAKRAVESGQNGRDSHKKSKVANGNEEEKKSGAINRLWSEDDEIAILKGIIEYSKTGADIHADMAAFHEFIKKSLHVDVSKSQLMDKIRRLKKKYQVNSGKGEKGEDPVFSKPHDHKAFELSKKIWGDGGSNAVDDGAKSSSKRAKKSVTRNDWALTPKDSGPDVGVQEGFKGEETDIPVDRRDFWSMYPQLGASMELEKCLLSLSDAGKNLMKENMCLIGDEKAKELEEKWKKLQADETALFLKRVDLISEQTKLFLDAVKSSRS